MSKTSIIARSALVLGAVSALGVGATFAALQSTATLTNNTISSATASLLVDGPDGDSTTASSETGFTFNHLVPGGAFSSTQTFTLENEGDTPVHVSVHSTGGSLTGILDKTKVKVKFTKTGGGTAVEYTLQQLETLFNPMPGVSGPTALLADDPLTAGTDEGKQDFTVEVRLEDGAVSGSAAVLSGFDLIFTGTVVTP